MLIDFFHHEEVYKLECFNVTSSQPRLIFATVAGANPSEAAFMYLQILTKHNMGLSPGPNVLAHLASFSVMKKNVS
jgi:hypothetical protein